MTKENIHVIIRFRPINKREKKEQKERKLRNNAPSFQNNDEQRIGALEICGVKSSIPHNFTFDRILEAKVSQESTFEHVAEHVCDDVLSGYNGCIFAYGQTGSGKTFTMFGPEGDNAHPTKMGIIPRSISYIFSEIEEDEEIMEARIKVSFVEIYKEKLRDLLNPSSKKVPKKALQIRLGQNGETRISNVTETHVLTLLDVLQLMEVANSYRTKAETSMNHSSSRSHMLMTLTVALRIEDGSIRVGKMNFCDLAGSEKVRKTNATGNRLKEAMKINLSLTILGQVISALSQNKKHVPFRDSKLTHVLKDSLGGNCKTTLIVNCSPHIFNREETINSLRFGTRCKLITNEVKINKVYSNGELLNMIEKLRKENTALTQKLKNKGFAEDIIASPKSNKLFNKNKNKNKNKKNKKGSNYDKYKEENDEKYLGQIETLKNEINKIDDKNHYLQIQNNKLEEKRYSMAQKLEKNQKQITMLNGRLTDYQSRSQQQQKDINHIEAENQQLKLQVKSLQNVNDEYKMEITDITKDRHYKTSKLNNQLSKFKELHNDAVEETTELMDEVLKLKQSLEKSEAIIDAQDNQLIQKRKDIDNLQKELVDGERRVSNIFKEKISIQSKLNEMKRNLSEYQSKIKEFEKNMASKDDEIEELKGELEERTQSLTAQNYELTQKLEQREMIQHAYSIRSTGSNDDSKSSISSVTSPSGKTNTAILNAQIASSNTYHPKIVPTLSTKASFHHLFAPTTSNDETSAELLIKASSLNNMQDVITAEQTLLAQHDYLQKMETERLVQRHSTGAFPKRKSKLQKGGKMNIIKSNNNNELNEKISIEKEIGEKQIKLDSIRNVEMPTNKEKRLAILLQIATLEDDVVKLKRKLQIIDKKLSKTKKLKSNQKDNDIISKVTTMDAMNYVDAALTLKQVQDDDDDDDDDELRFDV